MALNFTQHYQLGWDGELVFERDLTDLARILGRPFPEFMGAQIHDNPEGELQWTVVASVRGRMGDPTSDRIQFNVVESTWVDGLARGMQEMLARLCGHHPEEIQGTRFQHYARRDDTGSPLNVPMHHELRHHVDHLDFMLYSTQQDLDRVRAKTNLEHFELIEAKSTIKILAKERRSLRRQRDERDATILKLQGKMDKLKKTVQDLEGYIEEIEEEGIDLRKERDALISDDEDFEEDMDMEVEDEDDDDFIEPEEEHVIYLDEDEPIVPNA